MSNWIYIDDIEVTDKIICTPLNNTGRVLFFHSYSLYLHKFFRHIIRKQVTFNVHPSSL